MKKRVLAVTLATVLAAGVLSACASKTETTGADATPETAATEEAATEEAAVESKGTITVAATSVPHAEILEQAKPLLAAKGWDLEVTEFSDYVLPNEVVESGEIDANYFQHQPYLDSFNEEKGTHIVSVAKIHYEPFGIYAGKESDLADISEGAEIAIPNDTTNEARALLLLQDNGLITLNDGVGITATVNDIKDNPKNLKFVELAAEQIARTLPDVAFGIINGNYALEAGLTASEDAIVTETSDSEAAKTYANIVAVKEGNENNEGIQALIEVLKSDEIKQFINDNYQGSVVPFED
ncbi:MAG: MetQ/NlpA family ABC transporter substrate-binding protein [Lachnospiraceae bacterium]|nr:MetQ/NlpA family ABC transporter substrate-binding protein [Lachnospiraceae bacterium]